MYIPTQQPLASKPASYRDITLPERDESTKDNDLESVRGEAWFKEIKWKVER
jgi:hypothetical protein